MTLYFIVRDFTENSGSYAGFVENIAKYAHARGIPVVILAGLVSGRKPRESLGYAEVRRFPLPRWHVPLLGMNTDYLALGRRVRRFFRDNPPVRGDMIIANSRAALGVLQHRYVHRMGQPARIFRRNMDIAKDEVSLVTRIARFIHLEFQRVFERRCVRNATAFIFSSEESRTLNDREYGVGDKPYITPHSGVCVSDFLGGRRLGLSGRFLLFISAGTEQIRKGVFTLERAIPEIFRAYPDVKLLHVGERFAWNVPDWCKPRIVSVGRVPWDRMRDYYATADIVIFTPLNELIPNALFEAMVAGCPIITSDMQGVREYIGHLKEGYVFPRGDAQALIAGIRHLLDNGKHRKQMAAAAQKRAKDLDYSVYARRLLDLAQKASA